MENGKKEKTIKEKISEKEQRLADCLKKAEKLKKAIAKLQEKEAADAWKNATEQEREEFIAWQKMKREQQQKPE